MLPADLEEVRKIIMTERKETKKTESVIGEGGTISKRCSSDKKSIIADLRISLRDSQTLRPYDAVYYGQILGVVVNHEGNNLRLVFHTTKRVSLEGELKISEPLMMYDSALSIIDERAVLDEMHF